MGKRRIGRPLHSQIPESLHTVLPDAEVDLHGLRRVKALSKVDGILDRWAHRGEPAVLRIITGKGNRSEGDAVLLHAVGDRLRDELGGRITEMARDAGGGGWLVRMAAR